SIVYGALILILEDENEIRRFVRIVLESKRRRVILNSDYLASASTSLTILTASCSIFSRCSAPRKLSQ
ncbi:MAG: hypothetical protein RLY17_2094, partial [Pseudomonadota bacterium]